MKKKLLTVLKYLIFLGIGIFLTWWQISKMTPLQKIQFTESLRHAHYIYLIPVFILTLFGHISRAVRWKILIEPMGYKPKTSNTFYTVMCGYLANTFLPRAGEILRCTLLSRYEKIPVPKLFGTMLIERILDLFCYAVLIVITFLIQIETVSDFIKTKISQMTSYKQAAPIWLIVLIILILAIIVFFIIKWIFKRYKSHPYIIKVKGLHIGLKEGFSTILHLKKRKKFLAHTIFIWTCYFLEVYIGFSALSATSSLGIGAAFSVLSLATLAMIVSPGGLGAFPIAVQQVLLIYNVDNISFGWLMWGVTTGIVIAVGIVCFGLLIYQNKNKNEKERHIEPTNIYD
ncbi:MAG TPA: lysylphosphatidylglycerol synthase transmembrane domain-containing protein [Hanamia sp.]|jgi:glycosyltransferase 2 family protein|nr:lysylphosphatidylglycerol synthase transmembrane domain-containing protein [Hanamia sp.]